MVLQHNVCSLPCNISETKLLLQTLHDKNSSVNIMLLCETFLNKNTANRIRIPGYTLVSNYRQDHKGGGTSVLIKDGIPFQWRQDLDVFIEKHTESTFVEISIKNGTPVVIGSLYRTPNTPAQEFIDNVSNVIKKIRCEGKNKEAILGMDHNLDLLHSDIHTPTHKFLNMLLDMQLFPTLPRPSRITQKSATLIDNIFISEKFQRDYDSALLVTDTSDYLPIMCLLKQTKIIDKNPLIYESRSLTTDKLNTIKNKLYSVDWHGLLNKNDVDENFNLLNDKISDTMDEVAPVRTIRISAQRRYIEPWMSKGLESSSRKKAQLYKATLKTSATDSDRQKYRDYRNTYNRLKWVMMITYYKKKIQESKMNTKKLWKVINNIIGKHKHSGSIIPYITVDGARKYDPDVIANEFGKFYSQLGSTLTSQIKRSTKPIEEHLSKIPRTLQSLALHSTSASEIEKITMALPSKTSFGHDKISNVMLKSIIPAISIPLSIVFNQSILTGKFPHKMKQAEVVPLYKGKNMDLVVNYRPISLLITISKLLEKVVYRHVYSFLEKYDILFQSQYGFHSNHNCEHAILELSGKILQAREKSEHPACIFLDLSKAFDTLNHQVLLRKLNRIGIRGISNTWFESYLSGHSLVAKVTTSEHKTTYSDVFDISFGTAQGSCLGPLLFLLFCNDIHLLPLYSQLILFADDTTLFNSHRSKIYLEYMLN